MTGPRLPPWRASPDAFDVRRFPSSSFTSHEITRADDSSYAVTGTLTMHGASREVTPPVTYFGHITDLWGKKRAGFGAATTIDCKDCGIRRDRMLENRGLLLGDDADSTVVFAAVREDRRPQIRPPSSPPDPRRRAQPAP